MEKNLFDKFPKLNLLMIIISVVAIIAFISTGDWIAGIWAFNTAIWCAIEGEDCMQISEFRDKISELRNKISELLDEKYRKK